MSGLALTMPWRPLDADVVAAVPAQLGVYEIGVDDGDTSGEAGVGVVRVARIGFAGGRSPFGLRSALADELAAGSGSRFRFEVTHGYLTRWEELLMLHQAGHGALPPGNADRLTPVGRLRPLR